MSDGVEILTQYFRKSQYNLQSNMVVDCFGISGCSALNTKDSWSVTILTNSSWPQAQTYLCSTKSDASHNQA